MKVNRSEQRRQDWNGIAAFVAVVDFGSGAVATKPTLFAAGREGNVSASA
jgi:hypothetical protein